MQDSSQPLRRILYIYFIITPRSLLHVSYNNNCCPDVLGGSITKMMFVYSFSENILMDIFHGCGVVICALSVFISLVWLREHIVHGGGPDWLMDPPIDVRTFLLFICTQKSEN